MKLRRGFPSDPESVPAARRFATEVLSDSPPDMRESVELMVSELATNGIRHGHTSFELTIERIGEGVRVEVTDHGGGTPAMRFPGPDEPTGRGLQIVDMLSDEWGFYEKEGRGKTVWFSLGAGEESTEQDPSVRSRARIRQPPEPTSWTFVVAVPRGGRIRHALAG